MAKLSRIALLCAAAATLAGCSATRLTYNHADWLLKRELIKNTCPSEAQQKWLSNQLAAIHRWHRRQELPRYARALRALAGALARPLKKPAMVSFFNEMDGARRRFSRRLAHPAGTYMEGLASPQVRCMIRQMSKKGAETLKETQLPRARYVEVQREKLEDRLDDFMGDLSKPQQAAADRLLAARRRTHQQMATAWHNWGRRLVKLLRVSKAPAARRKRLRAAMSSRFALYSTAERKVVQAWDRQNRELTWAVARLMTPAQRGKLKKSLLGLAADFEALSRQP